MLTSEPPISVAAFHTFGIVADRQVKVSELVGAADIADRLGIARVQTVHNWIRRGIGFPAPVTVISRVQIWVWPDVERWAEQTGRLGPWARR